MLGQYEPYQGKLAEGFFPVLKEVAHKPTRSDLDDPDAILCLFQYAKHLFSAHWFDLPAKIRTEAVQTAAHLGPQFRDALALDFLSIVRRKLMPKADATIMQRLTQAAADVVAAIERSSAFESEAREKTRAISQRAGFWEQTITSRHEIDAGKYTDFSSEDLRKRG